MRTVNQEDVTRNLLQFCYTCEDAHLCTTEEACQECWTAKGMLNLEEEDGAEETRALLQEYYA